MRSALLSGRWMLFIGGRDIPARIFCGLAEVAVVNDHDVAHHLVCEHNGRLLIADGADDGADCAGRE